MNICTYSMGDLRTQFSILRQRSFTRSICTYSVGDLRTQFSILRQRSFTRSSARTLWVTSAPSSPSFANVHSPARSAPTLWVTSAPSSPSFVNVRSPRSICTYSMGDIRTQFSILRQRSFTRSDLHLLYG